jgi:hypothetical protein
MEWLLLIFLLAGVVLTLRSTTSIAPLQPTWMQREIAIRYAMSFLVHTIVWPLHLGRDRYDEEC